MFFCIYLKGENTSLFFRINPILLLYSIKKMKNFKSLSAYCQAIQISPPKYEHFDIRSFAENMSTVVHQMPPFGMPFMRLPSNPEAREKPFRAIIRISLRAPSFFSIPPFNSYPGILHRTGKVFIS